MRWETLAVSMVTERRDDPWWVKGWAGPTPDVLARLEMRQHPERSWERQSDRTWMSTVELINELGAEGWRFMKDDPVSGGLLLWFQRGIDD